MVTNTVESAQAIPAGLLLFAGMQPHFIATFSLFCGVLLLWTITIGWALEKTCGLPVIAGRIIAGLLLGPSFLNISSWSMFVAPLFLPDYQTGDLYSIATVDLILFIITVFSAAITVSYLLWIAGHETDLRDIFSIGFTAVSAGFFGAILPIVMITGMLYFCLGGVWDLLQTLSIGIIFSATSVSIPVAMLFSYRKMHLRSSKATLGAAVIDDILAVIIVSLFFLCAQMGVFGQQEILLEHGHGKSIWTALGYMAVAFLCISVGGKYTIPPFIRWIKARKIAYMLPAIASCVMLFMFAFSELFGGLAGITGAYFAGLFHRIGDNRHAAEKVISPFVNSILLPIFLGSIGLSVNMQLLSGFDWLITCAILALAIISKLLSCYISTEMTNKLYRLKEDRWTLLESYLFGSSMVARGEVGLVIATIVYGAGFIVMPQYVISVVVIVLSTIVTPILLAFGFKNLEKITPLGKKEFSLNIGLFPVIGTTQMFHIIVGHLEMGGLYRTTVQISDGRKIVNLEGEDVKIILCPQEGILFKGSRNKVNEILQMIKHLMSQELERLPDLGT